MDDRERLRRRVEGVRACPIAHLQPRQPTRFAGEVKRIGVAPRDGVPALEVAVTDGTGDAVAIFTGRRQLGGMEHGRLVVFEGVVRDERGRKVVLNPAYTLDPT